MAANVMEIHVADHPCGDDVIAAPSFCQDARQNARMETDYLRWINFMSNIKTPSFYHKCGWRFSRIFMTCCYLRFR